ncbi:glycosyltransferase family 4 protein [Salinirubellus salinus]|uniref:Glycosyltransferase family 4 protein n=1 Tax=Salinirubellus salinus TaxID=1364945 RepID=A0A9E7R3S7_9EURY|nr:glycosyltransferase family 4 protein [Salinirubellus salinus]UWM54248.1 glycosyltransferase family 4 protein [Salinirubellus salinus]
MYAVLAAAVNHPNAVAPQNSLFNERICRALADTGALSDAVSPRPVAPPVGPFSEYSDLPRVEPWGPYTVHRPSFYYLLPKRLFYAASGDSYARRVPAYVEEHLEVPDVVHACHAYMDGYGMLPYCREHEVPLFSVVHGTVVNGYESLPPGVAPKVKETLEASTVCCVSDALNEKVRSIVDHDRVHTVALGADPARFPTDRREELRTGFGVPADAPLLLFVGAYTEAKGVDDLLAALSGLPETDGPDPYVAFVGHGGDRRERLERWLADSRFEGRVHWKLDPETVAEWFAAADLLVLPSHGEGRPTVVYEAMASETAVLATTVGGIPEQVADHETGRLVPPRDPRTLRDTLAAMLADPEALAEMGHEGRARLEREGWTWAGHAARLRELHEAVL